MAVPPQNRRVPRWLPPRRTRGSVAKVVRQTQVLTAAYVLESGGGSATTPHNVAFNPAGDLTVVVYIAPTTWTPAVAATVASYFNSVADGAWRFTVNTAGTLSFASIRTGVSTSANTTATVPSAVANQGMWLRASRVQSTGQVDFQYTNDPPTADPTSMTWLTVNLNRAGVIGVLDAPSAADVNVGGSAGGSSNAFTGKVYRAILYHSASLGSLPARVWDMNPGDWHSGTTWVSSTTGETWTITAGASVVPAVSTETPRPTTITRRRLALPSRRGRIVQVPLAQVTVTVTPPYVPPIQPHRPRTFRFPRRVPVQVPLTQTAPVVTVTYTPQIQRRPLFLPRIVRGKTTPTPPVVTVTVAPTYLPPIPHRSRLFLRPSRGRTSSVPPPTAVTVTATYVPPIQHRTRFLPRIGRGKVTSAPVVTVTVTPEIQHRTRLLPKLRRGSVTPTITTTVSIPPIGKTSRRLFSRRRGSVTTVPQVVVAVAPTYRPPIRRRPVFLPRIFRGRATPAPPPIVIVPPAGTLTVTFSSAATTVRFSFTAATTAALSAGGETTTQRTTAASSVATPADAAQTTTRQASNSTAVTADSAGDTEARFTSTASTTVSLNVR